MTYMIGLKPLKKRRKRHCKYCADLFTPKQSTQQFCSTEHRLTYWREVQTAVSEPLFKEFLEWKRQRQAQKAKQSRRPLVKAVKVTARKPQRVR